jgi:hypothetical protein
MQSPAPLVSRGFGGRVNAGRGREKVFLGQDPSTCFFLVQGVGNLDIIPDIPAPDKEDHLSSSRGRVSGASAPKWNSVRDREKKRDE